MRGQRHRREAAGNVQEPGGPEGEAARVKHAVNFAAGPVAAPTARAFRPPDVFDCCSHHPLPGSDGTARETAMSCWQFEQSISF